MQAFETKNRRPSTLLMITLLLATVLPSCTPVHFHQKARLSDPIMRFETDPIGAELHGHMIAPREAAIGGFNSVSAGGCSCK